jgi:hypothetical protein
MDFKENRGIHNTNIEDNICIFKIIKYWHESCSNNVIVKFKRGLKLKLNYEIDNRLF